MIVTLDDGSKEATCQCLDGYERVGDETQSCSPCVVDIESTEATTTVASAEAQDGAKVHRGKQDAQAAATLPPIWAGALIAALAVVIVVLLSTARTWLLKRPEVGATPCGTPNPVVGGIATATATATAAEQRAKASVRTGGGAAGGEVSDRRRLVLVTSPLTPSTEMDLI